jgi:hypothetical protein
MMPLKRLQFFALVLLLLGVTLTACGVFEDAPSLAEVRDSAETAATKASELATTAAPAAQTVAAGAREAGSAAAESAQAFATRAPTIIASARQTSAEAAATASVLATRLPTIAADARETGSTVIGTAEALATEGAPATLVANAETFALTAADTAQTVIGPIYAIVNNELGIVQPGPNGQTIVNVDEQLVNALITAYLTPPQAEQDGQIAPPSLRPRLEAISVSITPQHIAVIGRLSQPIRTPFEFHLVPSVSDGQLRFDLISARFGSVTAPEVIVGLTENAFNSTTERLMAQLPDGYVLDAIVLGNGQMQLFGRLG